MTFSPGYKIGAYTVVRMLGQGGMGDVYEVVHEQLGTHYALKAFACDYEEAEVLQRKFLEEGRLLSKLTHPRIVRVFDLAIEPESQMPYFVMDLVLYEDGEAHTVEDVEKSDITENLVYLWFKDVAEALDYIHSQGIVHRDVKPSNLLLNPDYHVTLADFGVSRIFGDRLGQAVEASKTMATKTGRGTLVLGTEHFIAPEVARGEEATPAADAYSLGMMCFRLLTGMWYEQGTDAVCLLAKFKLRWRAVLPQLLSPHPEKRPTELLRLKEQLKDGLNQPRQPDVPPKKRPKKRRDAAHLILAFLLTTVFVGGAAWFGYQGWLKYDADRQADAERMSALQRQLNEQKDAAQKVEAEQQRLRDEAARQKSEAEKIAEAKRKREAEEREKEARRITIGKQENAAEKKPSLKPSAVPVPKMKKDEFVLLDNEVEKGAKDYGPIPNKTYTWLKGGNAALPQEVKFQLSNGAVIDLVPLKAATFYMSNDWRDGRTHHKVTLTRPFWMSKYLLTADQCRDFAPTDYEDCRPIEKALAGTGYTVSKRMTRKQIDALCQFLSEKYRQQLPKGYVFRLPTEAEWEYALDLDGTMRMYEDKEGWASNVQYSSSRGQERIAAVKKELKLDSICEWCSKRNWWNNGAFTKDEQILLGGLMQPFASGVVDFIMGSNMLLDVVDGKRTILTDRTNDFIRYDEISVDPVSWIPSDDIYSATQSVKRGWEWHRYPCSMTEAVLVHIVLGPDLISERAWERQRIVEKKMARKEPLRMMPVKWAPDVSLRKLNGERKYGFVMDNGARMDFCLCPSGKFNMSNDNGDDRLTHRVTLTRPFLISKYNVTADQWRDFGPHDCEGVPRELEKLFKKEKYPICVKRNYVQWCKFCEHLTERYKSILPKGYVFRLPTEAEMEWAMIADENGNVRNLGEKFDDCSEGYRNGLSKLLDKKRFADMGHFDFAGWYREHYVGGRTAANAWGVSDFRMEKMCLDLLDADRYKNPESLNPEKAEASTYGREREYAMVETDPVRWDGRRGRFFVSRRKRTERWLCTKDGKGITHIVIGPDLISELQKKEDADYPGEDFGGVFLGDHAKVVDISSGRSREQNSPQGWKRLLSRENVIIRELDNCEDMRDCHTDKEENPWVMIELDAARTITGLQIDVFKDWWVVRHLCVWISDGSKEMRLVAKEDRERQRYRFDFQGKNIKAKYIRIGREPGFKKDWFFLHKVLIYGK